MFLGLDIGTTATKALLIDDAQRVVAHASKAYQVWTRAAGEAEQDPQVWIDAVRETLAMIKQEKAVEFAAVKRISFSGQMHSLVALGADKAPLRDAMLWNDTRGQAQSDALMKLVPQIETISGAAAMPSFTASKLFWLKQHEPAAFKSIRHILLPKDFVRLWLTGELGAEHSDAAGTQLYDQRQQSWSKDICSAIGIGLDVMPKISASHHVAGRLRGNVAQKLGLSPDVEVCFGAADTPVGAVALGCIAKGDSFISLGTGSLFATITDGYQPTTSGYLHNFAHCIPGHYYRMGAMLNGASCLAWAAQLVGAADIGGLLMQLTGHYQGPSRVMFIPYLNGERTPHNNTNLRGALLGLDSATTKLDVAQAVIEGVSFCLRHAMDAMGLDAAHAGTPGFIGGGARSALWAKILAATLNVPLASYTGADYWPALGAARLAMLDGDATNLASIASKPEFARITQPDAELAEAYAARYAIYLKTLAASFAYAEATAAR